MPVGEALRNSIHEVLRRQDVFGIATVDGVAGEGCIVAEIFSAAAAVFADAASAMQPGNSDAVPDVQRLGLVAELFHDSDHLVTGNDRGLVLRQLAFDDVKVGPANSTRGNAHEHLIASCSGPRNIPKN